MEEDEERDIDHTRIDDSSSAQGGDKKILELEKIIQTCVTQDDVIETKVMQSPVENELHEDVEWQNELWHALDVLIGERKNVRNATSIMA